MRDKVEERIQGIGICKDCGNGTLNNELNRAFEFVDVNDEGDSVLICRFCGSSHVDVVVS